MTYSVRYFRSVVVVTADSPLGAIRAAAKRLHVDPTAAPLAWKVRKL